MGLRRERASGRPGPCSESNGKGFKEMKSQVFFAPARRDEGDPALALKAEQAYLALGLNDLIEMNSYVALKVHFGEKGNTGYIRPAWLERLIWQVRRRTQRSFLTDSNTLYTGKRSNAVDHLQLAYEHGFTPDKIAIPVIIADGLLGNDDEEIKVDLPRIKSAKIGRTIVHSDALICLSHFTGHVVTGLACAIKNLGMGCAARAGKLDQHSEVHPRVLRKACRNCSICLDYCPAGAIIQSNGSAEIQDAKCTGCGECLVVCKSGAIKMRWDEDSARTQEKTAEYAWSVRHALKGKVGFLNFLLKITKDCDCMAKDQPPIVDDIGILSSLDPVALDKASADLVLKKAGEDVLRRGYNIDWAVQLRHGEKIGLGSMDYKLSVL